MHCFSAYLPVEAGAAAAAGWAAAAAGAPNEKPPPAGCWLDAAGAPKENVILKFSHLQSSTNFKIFKSIKRNFFYISTF